MTKIAVVGAGLSGLAIAWHLKKCDPKCSITVYDPLIASERSSSLASLLYPFTGMRSKLNEDGFQAFNDSLELLKLASKNIDVPFYRKIPLLKIPKDIREEKAFITASESFSDLHWHLDPVSKKYGLWNENVIQVRSDKYLEALLQNCINLNIEYEKRLFIQEDEKNFDQIVYATGHLAFKETHFTVLKGQALIIKWPSSDFNLNHCLIHEGLHLIPSFDKESIYIGNTFEREFDNLEPNIEKAIELLWPLLEKILPTVTKDLIIEVKAGARLTAPNRLPKIGRISSNKWIFTALGSKGLLYHSYLAKILSKAILFKSTDAIPKKYLYK